MVKFVLFSFFIFTLSAAGQENRRFSIDEAVAVAMANNPVARNAALEVQKDAMMWRGAVLQSRQAERSLTLHEFTWQVKAAYFDVVYFGQRLQTMREHAHYFEALISLAEIRLFSDSITDLVKVSTGARYASYLRRMYIAEEELIRARIRLGQLMCIPDVKIGINQTELQLYQIHPDKPFNERFDPVAHKLFYAAQIAEAESNRYQGGLMGLSILRAQRTHRKKADIDANMKINEVEHRQFIDHQHIEILKSLLNEYYVQISFSKENMLIEAKLVLEEIVNDFSAERISCYAEAFTRVSEAVYAKLEHLEYILLYNRTALELEYFTH